ncbi:hypothetical protein RB195_009629 [Necator americanus]|uniref:Uncharacterized protein n=1 Tax=Necator americanus TaxID=51031 RepID=A0ABR1CU65_NECAM
MENGWSTQLVPVKLELCVLSLLLCVIFTSILFLCASKKIEVGTSQEILATPSTSRSLRKSKQSLEGMQASGQKPQTIEKTIDQKKGNRRMKESNKCIQNRALQISKSRSDSREKKKDRRVKGRQSPRRSSKTRKEEKSRATYQQSGDPVAKTARPPGKDKPKIPSAEGDQVNLKGLKTTQEEEIITVTNLEQEPGVAQASPNQYEADAGHKKMVVDPGLVMRRGNIDDIYQRVRTHFVDQMREVELPSDRDLDKSAPNPKQLKLRFNDGKCVMYETNDQATIDDMEEAAPEPEEDIY